MRDKSVSVRNFGVGVLWQGTQTRQWGHADGCPASLARAWHLGQGELRAARGSCEPGTAGWVLGRSGRRDPTVGHRGVSVPARCLPGHRFNRGASELPKPEKKPSAALPPPVVILSARWI